MIYVVQSNNIYIGVYIILYYIILYYIHYSLPNNNNLVRKFPDIFTIRIICDQHHIAQSTFNISHITSCCPY